MGARSIILSSVPAFASVVEGIKPRELRSTGFSKPVCSWVQGRLCSRQQEQRCGNISARVPQVLDDPCADLEKHQSQSKHFDRQRLRECSHQSITRSLEFNPTNWCDDHRLLLDQDASAIQPRIGVSTSSCSPEPPAYCALNHAFVRW